MPKQTMYPEARLLLWQPEKMFSLSCTDGQNSDLLPVFSGIPLPHPIFKSLEAQKYHFYICVGLASLPPSSLSFPPPPPHPVPSQRYRVLGEIIAVILCICAHAIIAPFLVTYGLYSFNMHFNVWLFYNLPQFSLGSHE